MATTFSGSSNVRSGYSLSDSPVIGAAGESAELRISRDVGNGTGSGEANVAWRNEITVANGSVYSLDLLNLGATVFGFGGKVAITTLKEVFVVVKTTTAGRYLLWGVIAPGDTTAYAARLGRGGDYRWADYADGIAITNGVNNTIYVANPSGGAVTFDVLVVGVGSTSDT